MGSPVLSTSLRHAVKLGSGKVRDLYRLGDDLLLVATDRISAYDVVMADPVPGKGQVLTAVSAFWFDLLADVVPNHLLSIDVDSWPELDGDERAVLGGRSMRCRRATPLPVEWVVRGYLTGSAWKDYQAGRPVSGVVLPPGLEHASQLPEPILTPSTKGEPGQHDEPIPFAHAEELCGASLAAQARDAALALYRAGSAHARERGIVIADTKFEFATDAAGALLLIDECLTPDSSRFWDASEVRPGAHPRSFDKQVLRDWLTDQGADGRSPPPRLPPEVVERTAATYREMAARLTGAAP